MSIIGTWLDTRALNRVVAGHERQYDTLPTAQRFGRGTLRMVVARLRDPDVMGGAAMTPGEILGLITLILQLIVDLRGIVSEIVDAIRRARQPA
jgi:hypothetical protein